MPTTSRPALDVKGDTSPVKEDASKDMSSLAYSSLGLKDRKAVAILHYPGAAANGTKASEAAPGASGSASPMGSPTTTPLLLLVPRALLSLIRTQWMRRC
ncbi:Cbp/p300 interacting transactivator with Glu/Asp rich carboxy-terminal domain 1 [Rhinolophus ferrumequinum]|uniref:Cbp/p300 interacting transactivator with Glu/Asp rich carboxy-terminal domain 1 n=1 Tax=Rhinolophus ferrumequinum TaxID=59479 RepID=A0A7J8AT97_RHIFE|nr:Cbp/p300 interacting transactivator with Glu/Asp rich carboxy-terminal domain 1 [Rhinolophus ferrumequinum]